MDQPKAVPFNQRIRIFVLRVLGLAVVLPLVLFTSPWIAEGFLRDLLRLAGTLLVIAGVLGRFWAILYIGARKNQTIMRDGPYSLCRHPLYLSSTLGVAGFGLLLGSLTLTLILTALVFGVLSWTASREEAWLRSEFGTAYDAYAAQTPRIWPLFQRPTTPDTIEVVLYALKETYADALVFLSFLPLALILDLVHRAALLPTLTLP